MRWARAIRRRLLELLGRPSAAGLFRGDFGSFAEAMAASANPRGYEDPSMVEWSLDRTLRVAESCRTDPTSCTPAAAQLLAAMFLPFVASRGEHGRFRVLDFGGGLGVNFFRLGKVLGRIAELDWDVVETPSMARLGRERMAGTGIRFHDDLGAMAGSRHHVVLAVGSLQYTEEPRAYYRRLAGLGCRYILLDVLPFIEGRRDRLALQVEAGVKRHCCPSWFFGREGWADLVADTGYVVAMRWRSPDLHTQLDATIRPYEGMLLERPEKTAAQEGRPVGPQP